MIILENWQYRYVEKCLYSYNKIKDSELDTEKKIVSSIEAALEFFKDSPHEKMMREFYFKADKYRRKFTVSGHHNHVCLRYVYTEPANGFVIRREIIYKVAMYCYYNHIFKLNKNKRKAGK